MTAAALHPASKKFSTPHIGAFHFPRGEKFWWPVLTLLFGVLLAVAQTQRFVLTTAHMLDVAIWGAGLISCAFVMCAIASFSLFKWGEIEFGCGMLMGFSWIITALIWLGLGALVIDSKAQWVGSYQYNRIAIIEKAQVAIKKDGSNQMLPRVLADATNSQDASRIHKAHAFSVKNWWGDEFRRLILSARLLGLSDTMEFKEAVVQGWLPKTVTEKWSRQLRENPPQVLHASPLHQAAYLRVIGEVPMERKFNIEGNQE